MRWTSRRVRITASLCFVLAMMIAQYVLFLHVEKVMSAFRTLSLSSCTNCGPRVRYEFLDQPITSVQMILVYGVAYGLSPCLLPLISLVFAICVGSSKNTGRTVLMATSVGAGFLYAYWLSSFIAVTISDITSYPKMSPLLLAAVLLIQGFLCVIYAACDWVGEEDQENARPVLLQRTISLVKRPIEAVLAHDSTYLYLGVGAFFSFARAACITSFLPFMFYQAVTDADLLVRGTFYSLGIAIPLLISGLAGAILPRVCRFSEVGTRGAFARRVLAGAAFIASAYLLLFNP